LIIKQGKLATKDVPFPATATDNTAVLGRFRDYKVRYTAFDMKNFLQA